VAAATGWNATPRRANPGPKTRRTDPTHTSPASGVGRRREAMRGASTRSGGSARWTGTEAASGRATMREAAGATTTGATMTGTTTPAMNTSEVISTAVATTATEATTRGASMLGTTVPEATMAGTTRVR